MWSESLWALCKSCTGNQCRRERSSNGGRQHDKLIIYAGGNLHVTPQPYMYRSVPLIRPPILYTTSSQKRGGGVFSRTQLVSIICPLTKFRYVYDIAKVHVHSYKSTNDRQYCSWSSCVVSLHWREELHFNSRAR